MKQKRKSIQTTVFGSLAAFRKMMLRLPSMSLLVVVVAGALVSSSQAQPQGNPALINPVERFTVYSALSEDLIATAGNLGYTESTWNNVGTAAIEGKSYETIGLETPALIPDVLKIVANEGSWDCYINH